MSSNQQISLILENIRQKKSLYQLEEFVADFLEIWSYIHQIAPKYTIEDAYSLSKQILESKILPFYEKYKDQVHLEFFEGWIKHFASIAIPWDTRGSILFPLKLIVYEIYFHQKGLLRFFLQKLQSKEILGTKDELFEYLFPILINFSVPLDELDILLLKAFQSLEIKTPDFYKSPKQTEFADFLSISPRTVIRRMNVVNLLQLVSPILFLDMGKLGYETLLYIHSNPLPEKFKKYLLFSSDLVVGTFSVVQIPYKSTNITYELETKLDLVMNYRMKKRIQSWNLSGLASGEITWTKPPTFLYNKLDREIITPSPKMEHILEPAFDPFRPLTPADIKILDFFITKGSFRSITQLSSAINVSVPQITSRLNEYVENKLVVKTNQFFNLGLDLSLILFILTEEDSIPWVQHLLTFPKVDVFLSSEETQKALFGFVKLPNQWIKPLVRQIDNIKKNYKVKIYYKISSPLDYFKWGISLKETYV